MRLVIASEIPLVAGEHKSGRMTDKDCEWHDVTFVVVREVTEDAYVSSAVEYGASEDDVKRPFPFPQRYYEVAMD